MKYNDNGWLIPPFHVKEDRDGMFFIERITVTDGPVSVEFGFTYLSEAQERADELNNKE